MSDDQPERAVNESTPPPTAEPIEPMSEPVADPISRRRATSDSLDDLAALETPAVVKVRPPSPGMRAVTVVPAKAPRPSLHDPRPAFPAPIAAPLVAPPVVAPTVNPAVAPNSPISPNGPAFAAIESTEPIAPAAPDVSAAAPITNPEIEVRPTAPIEAPRESSAQSDAAPGGSPDDPQPPAPHPVPPPDRAFVTNDEDEDVIPELAAAIEVGAIGVGATASSSGIAHSSSPAASSSPAVLARQRARARQALLASLFVRRTLIPILLTLGALMAGLGAAWFALPVESPFRQSGSELPLAMVVIGPVFLVVAVLNMLQVRSALRRAGGALR